MLPDEAANAVVLWDCLEGAVLVLIRSRGGTAWGDLRDELPEIVRAEAMAKAKIACQLIYKWRTTLNGNNPPETG